MVHLYKKVTYGLIVLTTTYKFILVVRFLLLHRLKSVLDDVAIVSGAITYSEDLGLITNAVSTGSSNGSLDIVADALEDEITFTVTVVNSGGNKYVIDGDTSNPAKALTLYKGWTYTFDQSDSSNAGHPLVFKTDSGSYTTNVTVTGTAGQAWCKGTNCNTRNTAYR